MAKVEFLPEFVPAEDDAEFTVLMDSIKDIASRLIQESPHIPSEAQSALDNIKSNTFLLNFIASNSSMNLEKKQEVFRVRFFERSRIKGVGGIESRIENA